MLWIVTFLGSITGLLFGYDEGIVSGILSLLREAYHLTPDTEGILTSALPFGAFTGTLVTGVLFSAEKTSRVGRKKFLILAGSLFILGDCGELYASTYEFFTFSRFLIGLAVGTSIVVSPMYLSEIAPTTHRGAMIAIYQLAITVGIIAAYFHCYLAAGTHSWRIFFITSLIPAFILTFGILFAPESPRWLISSGQNAAAELALKRLRRTDNVADEILHIKTTLAHEPRTFRWSAVFKKPIFKLLLIGVGLFAIQQISGIDVIIYYAPVIFKNLGLPEVTSRLIATLGIGIVNCLTTILAILFMDNVGRRKLMLFGCLGTGLSLFIPAIMSYFVDDTLGYITVVCIFFYIFSFAISLGPIPYVIMAEIFPNFVRGEGVGLSSLSNWIFNSLMVLTFPILLSHMSIKSLFLIYSGFCFLSFLILARYMPETKNLSLEEIEDYVLNDNPISELGRKKSSKRTS